MNGLVGLIDIWKKFGDSCLIPKILFYGNANKTHKYNTISMGSNKNLSHKPLKACVFVIWHWCRCWYLLLQHISGIFARAHTLTLTFLALYAKIFMWISFNFTARQYEYRNFWMCWSNNRTFYLFITLLVECVASWNKKDIHTNK